MTTTIRLLPGETIAETLVRHRLGGQHDTGQPPANKEQLTTLIPAKTQSTRDNMNIKEMLQKKDKLEARIEEMLEEFSRETGLPFSNLDLSHSAVYGVSKKDGGCTYAYHVKLEITF